MRNSRRSSLDSGLKKAGDLTAKALGTKKLLLALSKTKARPLCATDELSADDRAFWQQVVKMHPSKEVTPFQRRVYLLCAKIPPGKVTTYGTMAKALASSGRAVGQALRHNPFAPTIPCHRVIASSLYIGGFKGEWGVANPTVATKIALLKTEEVGLDQEYVRSAHCIVDPCAVSVLPLPAFAAA